MATNIEVATKARRTQLGLVGGFCGIVMFGSLFSQTQRALLDAVMAPPTAFAAIATPPDSRILPMDQAGAFPRPQGFVGDRNRQQPARNFRGRRLAQNLAGTTPQAVPGVPDVLSNAFAPVATDDAPGASSSALGGLSNIASAGGGGGFPVPGSFSASSGGGSGAPSGPGGGTTPGTEPGTTPGTPGTTPGVTPDPGTTPGTTPAPGVSPVPEPATWAMLIVGFFFVGWSLRRQRRLLLQPAAIS